MRKTFICVLMLSLLAASAACSDGIYDPAKEGGSNGKNPEENTEKPGETVTDVVTAPPADLTQWLDYKESPLDPFYKKYVDCDGLPVLSSDKVKDEALLQVCYIARHMLSLIPEAREEMIRCHFRIGVVAYNENITDLPECKMMSVWWPETDWDARGRGYGATLAIPVMSIGEENVIEIPGFTERYWDQSIMVHEFAHNVDFALSRIDDKFKTALADAFANASAEGLWKGSYSMTNSAEYVAEGAQAWFNACSIVVPNKNGSGTFTLKDRLQLQYYDTKLYELCASVFPEEELKGYHFDKQ